MPYDTDERLKSRLDTNQLAREQLCLAVLALDSRFSDVRPRHPRGGPDGGRDMQGIFRGDHVAFGAVGFVNQANDSAEQKRGIKQKFSDDLAAAAAGDPKPHVFVFMTNVNLTLGEKEELERAALAVGFLECDVMDRERLRIALDATDGFAARFQYLGLTLSESEQACFFAKWGDDIQGLISTGFQRVERTLERLLFLSEADDVLDGVYIHFELDRTYSAEEIGHFRAFSHMFLREPKHGIFSVMFGSADKANRFRKDVPESSVEETCGIRHGVGGGSWEQHIDSSLLQGSAAMSDAGDEEAEPRYVQTGSSSAIGYTEVKTIIASYSHDDPLFRFRPRLRLKDLDGASWIPLLNASLALKTAAIHVYANGYKLDEIRSADFSIDRTPVTPEIPDSFDAEELADTWVRLRPRLASAFNLRFFEQTPIRTFAPRRTKIRTPLPHHQLDADYS